MKLTKNFYFKIFNIEQNSLLIYNKNRKGDILTFQYLSQIIYYNFSHSLTKIDLLARDNFVASIQFWK